MLASAQAIQEVGGYREDLIAGEDMELSVRLRLRGGEIARLENPMALHDAAIFSFAQWWKRSYRAGFAYAEIGAIHGGSRLKFWVKERRSNWIWGLGLPVVSLALVPFCFGSSLFLWLIAWGALGWKVRAWLIRYGVRKEWASYYALFCVLGKVPQALGQVSFAIRGLTGRPKRIIEHKTPGSTP